jgi:hypothetical protein
MRFSKEQMASVIKFLTDLKQSDSQNGRTRVEECEILFNSDMPNCIIVKYRIMGYRDGYEVDELRYYCFDEKGEHKDVRSIITDPNARWSFYHHCKELYLDGGMLKHK